jgi:hypothetical protein
MVSLLMPSGPELPLEERILVGLIRNALLAAVRDLRGVTPAASTRTVCRPIPNGWGGVTLPCPNYLSRQVWDAISTVWNSAESVQLTDYLWARGALKKYLSKDGEGVPDKTSWARFAWGELVHTPLLELLNVALVTELTETGAFTPWRIHEDDVLLAARDIARRLCKSGRHVLAMCPIIGLHFEDDCDRFESEPGISICEMTEDRQRLLLSRFEAEFVEEDMSSWAAKGLFEANCVSPWIENDDPGEFIASALDRLKWSTMLTFGAILPIEEGPVILRGPAGWRGRTLRRSDIVVGTRSLPHFQLTNETSKQITSRIDALRKAQKSTAELDQAVWHFGRACNASLARDILMDSTIGLELLLVPDPGETTYKLSLHGLALLGGAEGDAVADELIEIYGLRSRAAHGSASSKSKFRHMAPRARQLLANAIWAIAVRINDGSLDVSITKGDIGKAVKAFVFRRLSRAVHHGAEPDGRSAPAG